jgi:hypothetical protein
MTTAIAAESVQDAIEAYEAAKVVADRIDNDRSMVLYPDYAEREALLKAFTDSEVRLSNLLVATAGPGELSAVVITPDKTYIAAFEPYEEDGPLHLIVIPTTRVMDLRG